MFFRDRTVFNTRTSSAELGEPKAGKEDEDRFRIHDARFWNLCIVGGSQFPPLEIDLLSFS